MLAPPQFKFQPLHSQAFLFSNSNGTQKISLTRKPPNSFSRSTNLSLSHSISNKTQIREPIICARNNKWRSGSAKSLTFMVQSAYSIASKLNIIPEPLDLVIREFGGGDGGGLGFNKGFGWGNFHGRRKNNKKLGFLGFLIVCGLGMWLILGEKVDTDTSFGVLVLGLIGVSAIGWKSNVKDWVLGFGSCAVLVVLGLGREDLKNWAKGFRAATFGRRRRRRRRAM